MLLAGAFSFRYSAGGPLLAQVRGSAALSNAPPSVCSDPPARLAADEEIPAGRPEEPRYFFLAFLAFFAVFLAAFFAFFAMNPFS